MARERMRAKSLFREHRFNRPGRKPLAEAGVPSAVRDFFGAGHGDELVFEEGSAFVAERAAARGPYCVIYLERSAAAPEQLAPQTPATATHELEARESLAEVVSKKLGERGSR